MDTDTADLIQAKIQTREVIGPLLVRNLILVHDLLELFASRRRDLSQCRYKILGTASARHSW